MSVTILSVTTRSEVTVKERLALGPNSSDRLTDDGISTTQLKLTNASNPPVSAKSHFAKALSSGAGTLDLLALLDDQANTLATTGLRVQIVKVQNPNPDALAVTPASSNGYGLKFTVPPQGEILLTSSNLLPQVETSAHLLTLAGVAAETSNWMIILG